MEKIVVICQTEYEYDFINKRFHDDGKYVILTANENYTTLLKKKKYSEIVLIIQDQQLADEISEKILAVNINSTIYNIYKECEESDMQSKVRNFNFAYNWLEQIGYLREAKKEILEEIMKRGF